MVRSIVGFSVFAVVSMVLLKVIFALMFGVLGIVGVILKLAIWGFLIYLILKIFAPGTAARMKEVITGRPA
ncbi:MAG: hypothetical protein H0U85_09225 [Gemmatimonadales bacterium]|nr:hypothetical protein [Gemmatimonadales bacterium]